MLRLGGLSHPLDVLLCFALETAQVSSSDGTLDFPVAKIS